MSFAKIKSQTVPDMINSFKQQFNEFNSTFDNTNMNQKQYNNLGQKIQNFEFQMRRIESRINSAPDDKKIEYNNQFQIIQREYFEFKQSHQKDIQNSLNENSKENNSFNDNPNYNQHILYEQSLEEAEAEHLEYVSAETQRIARQMREINEISHSLNQELNKQHNKIVSIETITTKAVDHMEKGNKELEIAEKNQKTCNIC